MTQWAQRSRIPATYLNPAVIAAVIAAAAGGYEPAAKRPMIWPMAFIVSPLILHRPTRDALPRSAVSHLATWVSKNPTLRAGFPERARLLSPSVSEGLRFGLRYRMLSVRGGALSGSVRRPTDPELATLLKQAGLVGRWLAKIEQPATIFAIFGVEP